MRVVLYAEGARDTGGSQFRPAHGTRLAESDLGPAHVLVRRALAQARAMPLAAVVFEEPLRTARGRVAIGSDLLNPRTLRKLVTWLDPARKPEMAVILVDQDEDAARRLHLQDALKDFAPLVRSAVAVQEFEAWLVADETAAAAALGRAFSTTAAPESLRRHEAKALLDGWLAGVTDPSAARRQIAERASIELIAKRCPAFAELLRDLAA